MHIIRHKTVHNDPTGDTVAQCVSPFRNAKDFQANWCKGTDLYRRSHQHLNPGEQVHRRLVSICWKWCGAVMFKNEPRRNETRGGKRIRIGSPYDRII